MENALKTILNDETARVERKLASMGKDNLAKMFGPCYRNTLETTVELCGDTTFVITGDIPAMWLRDSSAQVMHYVPLAIKHSEIASVIDGVIRRQVRYILADPYANAFNKEANGNGHSGDITDMSPLVWERKYEIDSLCNPFHLAYVYWKETGGTDWLDDNFTQAIHATLNLWTVEQHHENSPYSFERTDCRPSDTLTHDGKGAPVGYTGMTWCGFRPSDDACTYGYLVPANLFAARVLLELSEICTSLLNDADLAKKCLNLRNEILDGVDEYGTVDHPKYGKIYAYETDGLGNYNLMDDANVPSLMSLPYLGCCDADDEIYQNTRRFILSDENPYYFSGSAAHGIGSPHTDKGNIWPIALSIQGLTTKDIYEKEMLMDMLESTTAGTGLMHESFDCNNPENFTRSWFAWANSIFSEFVLDYLRSSK